MASCVAMPSYRDYLQATRAEIQETDLQSVKALLDNQARISLVDVREQDEWVQGHIPDAIWIPRGYLEQKIEDAVPDKASPVILYCASGNRSVLGAKSLQQLGYTNVKSMAGGFSRWKGSGMPWKVPKVMTPEQEMRYSRHTLLPEVGVKGQLKLLEASVLCIGAGGLGSPSSLYLAAAGIGTIGLIDDDTVDATNLQRQILHSTERVGMNKVDSGEKTLRGLNPDVKVIKYKARHSQSYRARPSRA